MKRDRWVDVARGIAIILVVFGHVLRGLGNDGSIAKDAPIWGLDYAIYTFHMPLFFFLSGIFVEKSLSKGYRPFFVSKLETVAYPYLVWSLIQGTLLVVFAGATNGTKSWTRLVTILWEPLAPYWFLYSLFLCIVLFVLLRKLDRRLLLGVALLAYAAGEVYRGGSHQIDLLPDTTRGFLFYCLGSSIAGTRLPEIAGRPAVMIACAVVFGAAVAAGLVWEIPYEALLPAALAGIGLLGGLCQLRLPAAGLFERLGRDSMAIFVMHIIAAAGLRIILMRLTPIRDPFFYLLVGTVAGIVLPLVAYRVMLALGVERWFGLPAQGGGSRGLIKVALSKRV